MASLYMPDLPPNPTVQDISQELHFINLLMETADPSSHNYEYEQAHHQSLLDDLSRRLEAAETTAQSSEGPGYSDAQYNTMDNLEGTTGNGSGLSAGPDTVASPDFNGSSASSLQGSVAGSALSSPYEAPSNSRKRGITLSQNHAGMDHSERKRVSPAMTQPTTPSSMNSLEHWEDPLGHNSGVASHTALQATSNTQRPGGMSPYQTLQPGGMPTPQKPENTGYPPMQVQLPTRPPVPHFNGPPTWSFDDVNVHDETPAQSNSLHQSTTQTGFDLSGQNDLLSPFNQQSNVNNPQFGVPGFMDSLGNGAVIFAPSNASAQPSGQSNIIDLTGDDSSETVSIGENNNAAGFSSYTAHPGNFSAVTSNNMPGAFPADPFGDLDLAYTGQQSNNGPTFGQYLPMSGMNGHAGNSTVDGDFATDHDHHVSNPFSNHWMSHDELATFLTTPTPGGPGQFPIPGLPAFNGSRGSSFPESLPQLHSSADGYGGDEPRLKNTQDYNALIENIRPDEDIPPEDREQTPSAMSTPLMEHQKLGLAWLKRMEEGANKGGILADDMGLGKTVQALALILARPSEDPLRKTTLIIAPVALMRQWQQEIKNKVHSNQALKVHIYHGSGTKRSFSTLRKYDIVLTTFGTVAAEHKRKYDTKPDEYGNLVRRPLGKDPLGLLGDECKWYRIIIDEAQCIKNKSTLNAKAACELQSIHRLCMTGTPMMNSVDELYSLLQFLRIKPYNDWQKFSYEFSKPLKSNHGYVRKNAMKKLQGLLRAILLRRTKTSLIDGKPIITIPPKHVEQQHVVFSEDEQALYSAMEGKSVLQFNKYLKAGTVTNHYANILLLLLRLRQACCHPHLIKDLGVDAATEGIPEDTLLDLASQLNDEVVGRLKEEEGFECPICYDGVENPTIFIPCGHNTCAECFMKLVDPTQGIQTGNEGARAKCPNCRGEVNPKKVTDYHHFLKVFMPEKLPNTEEAEEEPDADSADSSDDEPEEEGEDDTLGGFIVPDEEGEEETGTPESDAFEGPADPAPVRTKKSKVNGKGKGKAPAKPKKTLAQLKKESLRNAAAKQKYLRRLRRNWQTSAKIEKTMEIVNQIHENDPTEKILIFSQWTSLLDLLEVPLHGSDFRYHRYDGSMRANDRVDAVNDFMENPNCKLMLVSLKAGNAGLNLNKASQVIILDPFWNPFIEDQAVDRAHRMMQKREVTVHRILVPKTVEDRIIALQDKKRDLITTALDERAGKSIARLGIRELMYLFGTSDTL